MATYRRDHSGAVVTDLERGETQDGEPHLVECQIPGRIALKGAAARVNPASIDLDSHHLFRPEEVHFVAASLRFRNPRVYRRARQAGAIDEPEHQLFDVVSCERGSDLVNCDDAAKPMRAPMPTGPSQLLLDSAEVELPQELGLIAGSLQPTIVEKLTDVEQGAGDTRARDPVFLDAIVFDQITRSVKAQAGAPSCGPPGDRHMNRSPSPVAQVEEGGGIEVRKKRTVTSRQDRGHPAAPGCQDAVPNGIDAPVNPVQAATGAAIPDRPVAQTDRPQLR